MRYISRVLLLIPFLIMISLAVFGQPGGRPPGGTPGPPGGPPGNPGGNPFIPIDGATGLLIAAGALFGAKKIHDINRK